MSKIYLISPEKINLNEFSLELKKALNTGLVPVFQLRLKDIEKKEILKNAKELQKICRDYNTAFILNDFADLAFEIKADGVHLGAEDGLIKEVRKQSYLEIGVNFVIGASCYDSKHSCMVAGEAGADYVSFGTFFPSKTKNSKGKPTTEILQWANEIIDLPTVAIGGITDKNCEELVKAGADFLAVISYVWQNENGVEKAILNLDRAIKNSLFV